MKYTFTIFLAALAMQGFSQNLFTVVTNADCEQNENSGSIDLTISGGVAPYTYVWSNNSVDYDTEDIENLSPGVWCVTVTDALCGIAELCEEIVCEDCSNNVNGDCFFANFGITFQQDGCTVAFVNTSQGNILSYSWNFGDGGIASSEDPIHNYCGETEDCFDVTLTVEDTNGNTNTATQEVCLPSIGGELTAVIHASTTLAIPDSPIEISGEAFGGVPPYEFEWDFDLWGTSSTGEFGDGPHQVTFSDDELICLFVVDHVGNQAEVCLDITVDQEAIIDVDFSWLPGAPAANNNVNFHAIYDLFQIAGTPSFQWTITPGMIDGSPSYNANGLGYSAGPTVLFYQEGTYDVTLEMCDDNGCFSITKPVDVGSSNPNFFFTVVPPPTTLILGGEMTFTTGQVAGCGAGCDEIGAEITWLVRTPSGVLKTLKGINEAGSIDNVTYPENRGLVPCVPISDDDAITNLPNIFTEVGCYTLIVNGNCGGTTYSVVNPCHINVIPPELIIEDITTTQDCDQFILEAEIIGGYEVNTDITTDNCGNTSLPYANYHWQAFDPNSPDEELENIFLEPSSGLVNCLTLNLDHPIFYAEGVYDYVNLLIKFTVEDDLTATATYQEVISVRPKVRFSQETELPFCPGTDIYMDLSDLVDLYSGDYDIETTTPFMFSEQNNAVHIVIPTGINVDVMMTLTITDNSTGCVYAQDFHVYASVLILDLGGEEVNTCAGGSSVTMLGGEQTATGGGGGYTYSWTPSLHLDNPEGSNPNVAFEEPGSLTYELIVIDQYGCFASDEVTVVANTSDVAAESGPGYSPYCHDEDFFAPLGLGAPGGVAPNGGLIEWRGAFAGVDPETGVWGALEPIDFSSTEAMPDFPEAYQSIPGSYIFTVRVTDEETGCYVEDAHGRSVLDRWIYEGFEQATYFVSPDAPNIPLWDSEVNAIYEASNDQPRGVIFPLTYEWLPNGDAVTDIEINTEQIPESGHFNATEANPSLTLRVTDTRGCVEEYETSTGLFLESDPYFVVTAYPGNVVCEDEQICFWVELHTGFSGTNGISLPSTFEVSYYIEQNLRVGVLDPSPQEVTEERTVTLSLIDGTNGIYRTKLCPPDVDSWNSVIAFYNRLNLNGIFNNGTNSEFSVQHYYNFYTFEDIDNIQNYSTQGCFTVPRLNQITGATISFEILIAHMLHVPPTPCETEILEGARADLQGGSNGYVWLQESFYAARGSDVFIHINPCVLEEDPMPLRGNKEDDKQEMVADVQKMSAEQNPGLLPIETLSVAPNPTSSEMNITYSNWGEKPVSGSIRLFTTSGQQIHTFFIEKLVPPGAHELHFDGVDTPSGVYILEFQTETNRSTVKVVKI